MDTIFKKTSKIFGYEKIKKIDTGDFYNPDVVFKNGNKYIIMESSTTDERKVHIGEMIQFLIFSTHYSDAQEIALIIFLHGKGPKAPTILNEEPRLQYYYDNYPITKVARDKIKGIFLADKNTDYTALNDSIISSLTNIIK